MKTSGVVDAEIRHFRRTVVEWAKEAGRRFRWRKRSASLYEKIISEVLLQRTRADVVAAFLPGFLQMFPSWTVLAKASEAHIGRVLKPIGLWRRRAIALRELAIQVSAKRGKFPLNRQDIEALPGVGQYIANAIEMFAHHRPRPLIDVNMARVLERFFGPRKMADIRYDPYLQRLATRVASGRNVQVVNWAILDFAASICTRRNPECADCALKTRCNYFAELSPHGVRTECL